MSFGSQIPDKSLLKTVTQKLAQRSAGSKSKITVAVRNGEVTLSGTLNQEYQRRGILSSLMGINGVRRVVDQMTLEPRRKRE